MGLEGPKKRFWLPLLLLQAAPLTRGDLNQIQPFLGMSMKITVRMAKMISDTHILETLMMMIVPLPGDISRMVVIPNV